MSKWRVTGWLFMAMAMAITGIGNAVLALQATGAERTAHVGVCLGAVALANIAIASANKERGK